MRLTTFAALRIARGIPAFVAIRLFTLRLRDAHLLMWAVAAAFGAFFVRGPKR